MSKCRVEFVGFILLALAAVAPQAVLADWKIQFDSVANSTLRLGGNTLRGSWCTRPEAEAYWNSQSGFEKQHSSIVGFDCGGQGQDQTQTRPELQLLKGLLDFIFAPEPDNSRQEALARQKAEEERRAEELRQREANQAAHQAWIDLQNREREARAIEEANKRAAGQDLLAKMDTVGGDELKFKTIGTDFFGTGKPAEVTLKAVGVGGYPTSGFSPMEQLRGTAFFFGNALEAAEGGDYENAGFLAGQADKVIQGQPTDVECNLAALPEVPEPPNPTEVAVKKKRMATLLNTFQEDVKYLQSVEIMLSDTKVLIKEAEVQKESAQTKLETAQKVAATAKPEEKPKADDLVAQALAALQNAGDELDKAKQAETDMIQEQNKVKNELKEIDAKIRIDN
jgi:hypothetical protein